MSQCVFTKDLGGGGLAVFRPKKEDWQPKMERNQRTPGCRRSQEDFDDTWRAPGKGPVSSEAGTFHLWIS